MIRQPDRRGIQASPDQVRKAVHNLRGEARRSVTVPLPPAAKSSPVPVPADAAAPPVPLAGALAVVAQAHAAVKESGSVAAARGVAEAVRAAGGVDEFLRVLDLVETVMGQETHG